MVSMTLLERPLAGHPKHNFVVPAAVLMPHITTIEHLGG